jgi:hypothetical protein
MTGWEQEGMRHVRWRAYNVGLWMTVGILAGCTAIEQAERNSTNARIDQAIASYQVEAAKVRIGDTQDRVLALLRPTQAGLYSNEIKTPEAIPTETATGEKSLIEIFFFRSSRHADEQTTDSDGLPLSDNFTPYIFTDGVLTEVGWPALLSLKIRTPSHQASPHGETATCQEYGPLAGCF